MNQWMSEDPISNLPPNFGDKLDLLGTMIVSIGNILTVAGIALEKQEVDALEENLMDKRRTEALEDSDQSNVVSPSDLGFALIKSDWCNFHHHWGCCVCRWGSD